VVEDRPIMSVKYCLPVPVFHFWPKLMYPAARSLCDSWTSCYVSRVFFPRCMKCQRGLAMRKVCVRLSVCPSLRLSVKRVHC